MSHNQYGFMEGYLTAMALTDLVDNIATLHTMSVCLHFEKAFDTIDHSLSLQKLGHYVIRGIANHWLSSYLAGRKQYLEIIFLMSKLMQTMCGVPQGSILVPKLFHLYFNDICNVSLDIKYILYADDTSILCSSNNI